MFILGLMLMGISVVGLIALAFVQARFPDAIEAMMLPPEQKKPTTSSDKLKSAMAPSDAESQKKPQEIEDIVLEDLPVNSMSHTSFAATPASE